MLNRDTTPFKPVTTEPRLAPLPFGLLEITGAEASAFAHAQFSSDVTGLADGHWQWSAWLTPKGRVIALFALLKLDAERLWLVLPDFPVDEFAARLQRYVFRSKVVLRVRDDVHAAADHDARWLASPAAPAAVLQAPGATVLDFGDAQGPRRLALFENGDTHDPADAVSDARWRRRDLLAGLPRLPGSQVEAWTPQMLGLDRLQAYSLRKGCYPGQEIVSRTHYLGQAKRGPVLLSGSGFACGDAVRAEDRDVGAVVAAVDDLAFAVIALAHRNDALSCGGGSCTVQPFQDGLAR